MVPVIRSVEAMNFADIEKAISALGEKVRCSDILIISFSSLYSDFTVTVFHIGT